MVLLVGRQNVGAEVPGRGDLRPARRLLVGEESDQWRIERNRGEAAHDHSVTRTLVRRGDHADARGIATKDIAEMTRVDRSAHGLASASCPHGFTSLGTRGVALTLVGAAGLLLYLFELGLQCGVDPISLPALLRSCFIFVNICFFRFYFFFF